MNQKEWNEISRKRMDYWNNILEYIEPFHPDNPYGMATLVGFLATFFVCLIIVLLYSLMLTSYLIMFVVLCVIAMPSIYIFYHNIINRKIEIGDVVVSKKHKYHFAEIKDTCFCYNDWGFQEIELKFTDFTDKVTTRQIRKATKKEQLLYHAHGSISCKEKDHKGE